MLMAANEFSKDDKNQDKDKDKDKDKDNSSSSRGDGFVGGYQGRGRISI